MRVHQWSAVAITGLSLSLLAGCAMDRSDLILRGGTIVTMQDTNPWVESLAMKSGVLVHVGENYLLDDFMGPKTEIIDLHGRTALPSMSDVNLQELLEQFRGVGLAGGREEKQSVLVSGLMKFIDEHPELNVSTLQNEGSANLIVLDRNWLEIPGEQVADSQVWMRIEDGKIIERQP